VAGPIVTLEPPEVRQPQRGRATSSFPVAVSPRIITGASVGATSAICRSTAGIINENSCAGNEMSLNNEISLPRKETSYGPQAFGRKGDPRVIANGTTDAFSTWGRSELQPGEKPIPEQER
jgi:hypothetical protein